MIRVVTSGAGQEENRIDTTEQAKRDQTYHAIGHFIFEFSQVEFTIRHHLAERIGIDEQYFSPVVESYDVALLITVAKQVFKKPHLHSANVDVLFNEPPPAYLLKVTESEPKESDRETLIETLLNRFHKFNEYRIRVVHGLWAPSKDGGTVYLVPRNSLTSKTFADQAAELEKQADELCKLRADLDNAFSG